MATSKEKMHGTFAAVCLEVIASINKWHQDWDLVQVSIFAKIDKLKSLSPDQRLRIKAACQIIGKTAWLEFFHEV